MGIFSDAAKRVLAFTTQRSQPEYTTPAARPSDGSSVNADTSVRFTRNITSEGSPARTRTVTGETAGSVPSPHGADRVQAAIDRRSGGYPRPASDTTANAHAPNAQPMPYGLQPDTRTDRAELPTPINIKGDQ